MVKILTPLNRTIAKDLLTNRLKSLKNIGDAGAACRSP